MKQLKRILHVEDVPSIQVVTRIALEKSHFSPEYPIIIEVWIQNGILLHTYNMVAVEIIYFDIFSGVNKIMNFKNYNATIMQCIMPCFPDGAIILGELIDMESLL